MKKRILALTLSLLMLVLTGMTALPAAASDVAPCYNNTVMASTNFVIQSNGVAQVYVSYIGYSGVTTGATITIKLEKRFLGLFWKDVDIGEPNDTKTITVSDDQYDGIYSVQLPSDGTYRATVKYVIRGTGGTADTIEHEREAKY